MIYTSVPMPVAVGCVNEPCELVIGGHSQGAGVAAVAAVDVDDLNPIVVSLNQPLVLIEEGSAPCKAIDPNRHLASLHQRLRELRFPARARPCGLSRLRQRNDRSVGKLSVTTSKACLIFPMASDQTSLQSFGVNKLTSSSICFQSSSR